jgi:hypothetical protein
MQRRSHYVNGLCSNARLDFLTQATLAIVSKRRDVLDFREVEGQTVDR